MNAIIVGPRGALRDGLTALLYTIPDIRVVSATEDYGSARELLEGQVFTFVLLQINSSAQAWAEWVHSVKARAPNTKMLALVGNAYLVSSCSDAGVDAVLIQGVSTDRLHQAVEALISSP